ADKSLVAQSQTGSGKSHAFLLPLFDKLEDRDRTQLVITAPSRELGEQLYKNASQISQFAPFDLRIERAFGGTDTKRQ
ncbi:DEAD/DEAH box helicase, partial [Aerococcus sp. UMB8608]